MVALVWLALALLFDGVHGLGRIREQPRAERDALGLIGWFLWNAAEHEGTRALVETRLRGRSIVPLVRFDFALVERSAIARWVELGASATR